MGVLKCYDMITSYVRPVGIGNERYQGEFYLLNSVEGVNVENTYWSPNKQIFKITNAEKVKNNTIIINQNFYPGWIVKINNNECERSTFYNGLPSTKIDSSTNSIIFEFNPILYYSLCK